MFGSDESVNISYNSERSRSGIFYLRSIASVHEINGFIGLGSYLRTSNNNNYHSYYITQNDEQTNYGSLTDPKILIIGSYNTSFSMKPGFGSFLNGLLIFYINVRGGSRIHYHLIILDAAHQWGICVIGNYASGQTNGGFFCQHPTMSRDFFYGGSRLSKKCQVIVIIDIILTGKLV